jgi:hypothetical protein
MWKIIKKETSKYKGLVPILQIEEKKINNPKKIADALNEHFTTTAENLITNNPDKEEAVKLLHKCKNNKYWKGN